MRIRKLKIHPLPSFNNTTVYHVTDNGEVVKITNDYNEAVDYIKNRQLHNKMVEFIE